MSAVIAAIICAVTAGFVLYRQELRHRREMSRAGAYWRNTVVHLCRRGVPR